MIVDLDQLKKKLGIALDDDSEDDSLSTMVDNATEWVQGQTHRRFDEPTLVTERITGTGHTTLWLGGHLELGNADHPEWEDVTINERVAWADPLALDPLTVFEARGGSSFASLVRKDGWVWSIGAEYEVAYYDGYVAAPGDIQMLVNAIVVASYRLDAATADGSAGITSETLSGVYSYNIDRRRASLEADGTLSDQSLRTLNRWKRGVM